MAIGERIKYIRNLKNFTQKYLGQLIGFPEKTADIRIAQAQELRKQILQRSLQKR